MEYLYLSGPGVSADILLCPTFLQWPYLSRAVAARARCWFFWQHYTVFSEDSQDVQTACGFVFMLTTRGGQESHRHFSFTLENKTKPNPCSDVQCFPF